MRRIGLSVFVAMVAFLSLLLFTDKGQTQTKPIELKLAQWDPPQSLPGSMTLKMVDRINEKAAGKLKVTAYLSESLLKQPESFRGTQLGTADISYFGPTAPGSPVVLGRVISLPFLGITSHEMATDVYVKLLKESPELMAEYKGLRVMGVFGIPLDNLHLVKKSVHVPADMKGLKIIAFGPRVDFMKELGATPVTISVGDWYTSLERGLVEGLDHLFPVLPVFKIEDLFKHHTVINASCGMNFFIFNEQKWKSLPPDLQNVIEEAANWRAAEIMKADRVEENRVIAYVKSKGHEVYYPTAEEMKLWVSHAKPVQDKWIADTEAKGLPAKKVFEQMTRIVKEYKK
jgi:TRAP-type C4-dicarboxylate transport system substrate-binding protein